MWVLGEELRALRSFGLGTGGALGLSDVYTCIS